ncbi:MAG TPA: hypothetical protein VL307_02150 [Chitinophagaceae bacterium]|nr:hypothetical protein [Chitinophagaceae bacterium]
MRKLCAFIFLFGLLQYCSSCKKEYSTENRTPADSLLLVKTARIVYYDASDAFDHQQRQVFTYDKTLHQTIVDITDSGAAVPGGTSSWTERFIYDSKDRLSRFTSSSLEQPASAIDFTYNAQGELELAAIQHQWLNRTVYCQLSTTVQNGQKTIVMYDTTGAFLSNTDTRPQITRYRFDGSNQLLQETLYYTVFKRRENQFEDTTDIRSYYDNAGFLSRQVLNFAYRFSQVSPVTDYARDSTIYTREGNRTEIRKTFMYIYKNLYWFSISEFASGFANALNLGSPTYGGPALKTGELFHSYPPNPAVLEHVNATFQNTFDSKGLLLSASYPKRFAIGNEGKIEVWYTYTRLPG